MQRSKTAPKGAAIFIANCLARDSYLLTNHNGMDTTAELLGVGDTQAVAKLVADLAANGDARAQVITLALVLGALESRLCGVSGSVHCSGRVTPSGSVSVRDARLGGCLLADGSAVQGRLGSVCGPGRLSCWAL